MPNLHPNSTNYVHSYEPNTGDLTMVMDYDAEGRPTLRTIDSKAGYTSKNRMKISDYTTERAIAKAGGRLPPRPFLFKSVPHSTAHYNQKPGQLPLLPSLPVDHWSICVLHLSLRIVGMMWEHSVLRNETLN